MRYLLLILALALALGGWWFVTRMPQQSRVGEAHAFTLVIENRAIVSGPSTLSVKEGDTVTLTLTDMTDESEEFHLHGYDKSVDLTKGEAVTLTFTASASGRFPFELEKSKTELGALEVQP